MFRSIDGRRLTRLAALQVVLGFAAAGCQSVDEDQLRAGIEAIWNHGKLDEIDARYSDSIAAQLRERVSSSRKFYPDLNLTADPIVIDGERFSYRWTMTGTHSKYNKKVELRGVTCGRVHDGKVVEEQIFYDRLDEADQLGFSVRSPAEL